MFVAQCFAFKGVERAHFATHFWSDPWRDAGMVLVAETTGEIAETVATLRIFDRRLYLKDGSILRVGGIGEVCTRDDWQRKGICGTLLLHASDVMKQHGMVASCLHTSSMATVYSRCGYQSIPQLRVLVCIRLRHLSTHLSTNLSTQVTANGTSSPWLRSNGDGGGMWVRVLRVGALGVELPLHQLIAHHAAFHKGRFCGAVVRDSLEYWTAFVCANMRDTASLGAYWMQDGGRGSSPTVEGEDGYEGGGGGGLRGFVSLKSENCTRGVGPRRLYLGDFCACAEEVAKDGGRHVLETFLNHALVVNGECGAQSAGAEEIVLKMPRPVAESMELCGEGGQVCVSVSLCEMTP